MRDVTVFPQDCPLTLLFSDASNLGVNLRIDAPDLFRGGFRSVDHALASIKKPRVGDSYTTFAIESGKWWRFRRVRGGWGRGLV